MYIGPEGPGGQLIEVLVVLTRPRDLFVFQVMLLRQLTAERAEFDRRGVDGQADHSSSATCGSFPNCIAATSTPGATPTAAKSTPS